jgi:hypothetical protein
VSLADRLAHLDPCDDALKWLAGYADPRVAWAECRRGDWLLWIAAEADIRPDLAWTLREIVAPAFGAVATALDALGVDHDLRHHAEQLRTDGTQTAAANAAAAARTARAAACAARAARAAAWAATAAGRAAAAATAAGRAAAWAATAAACAAEDAACAAAWAAQADAVRRLWPEPPPAVLALCEVTP